MNEAYLANLMGEDARTIEAGKNKIDGGTGNSFNDISDLEFKDMGISLKTKLKGVKGSLRDLMATLGIPFKIKGGRENTRLSSNSHPLHPGGLYYVFFGKDQSAQNYFDISTALITKESLIKYLRSQGVRFRKAPDGLSYAYMNSKLVEKIDSRIYYAYLPVRFELEKGEHHYKTWEEILKIQPKISKNIKYIDLVNLSDNNPRIIKKMFPKQDPAHPTRFGHGLYAEKLLEEITNSQSFINYLKK